MEYFASRWQDYHPIFVGAGCLALGYMYGRHCRSVVESHHIRHVPMELDATWNRATGQATGDEPERMTAIQGPASCASDSALNYSDNSDRRIGVTPERCGKRTVGQIDIFQMPKKKEDALWAQSGAFKKQKGVPVITIQKKESITESKVAEPVYDSDDEVLARRLEYIINRSASINKSGGSNHALKLSKKKKKKKSATERMTMSSKGKDLLTMDSHKSFSKTSTRSKSGLCDLANLQGECSLEDTCRSPKTTVCFENSIQVEATDSAHIVDVAEPVSMQCDLASQLEYMVSNPVEGHIGEDNVGLMDLQCELNGLVNDSNHGMGKQDEEGRLENVRTEDGVVCEEEDNVGVESSEEKVTANRPTELHVQDRCLMEVEREVEKEHKVPMDKVLKVEIYELLHAADCAKVSFQEIVSVLEEKLKVVLREDKAHIVSLVREVISISKLLEEEKALEGAEQVEGALNICC